MSDEKPEKDAAPTPRPISNAPAPIRPIVGRGYVAPKAASSGDLARDTSNGAAHHLPPLTDVVGFEQARLACETLLKRREGGASVTQGMWEAAWLDLDFWRLRLNKSPGDQSDRADHRARVLDAKWRAGTQKAKAGAKEKYDWDEVERVIVCALEAKGDFDDSDQPEDWDSQSDVISFIESKFWPDPDDGPVQSTLKDRVSKMVERWRARQR